MSGYSNTPLLAKLGYQAGDSIRVIQGPDWFLKLLSAGGISVTTLPASWAHGFFVSNSGLQKFLESVDLTQIQKGLWVSWPKKSSGQTTDLTEQTFRDLILPLGWVDTKVAAIDETWSALKFLRRRT